MMKQKRNFSVGKKIAMLVDDNFEDSEVAAPLAFLRARGLEVELIGVAANREYTGKHGYRVETTRAVVDASVDDYAGLMIPGGHAPDSLRLNKLMVQFVRLFCLSDKPVAAICHGPQLLIEADVVGNKTVTSWASVATDLKNAGAAWIDRDVVIDGNLITSRSPADLQAFCQAFAEQVE